MTKLTSTDRIIDQHFLSATFDGVIANYMLYHVPDRARALAEIKRVLDPDGVLYAMNFGRNHFNDRFSGTVHVKTGGVGMATRFAGRGASPDVSTGGSRTV